MRTLFNSTQIIAIGLIFWAALGYLMNLPSFPVVLPLSITSIAISLAAGFLKNHQERRKFKEFLESKKRDSELQEKRKDEQLEPGDKTGRSKVKAYFKERNVGLNWTGASVHGAVPQRKKRRSFLPKNR